MRCLFIARFTPPHPLAELSSLVSLGRWRGIVAQEGNTMTQASLTPSSRNTSLQATDSDSKRHWILSRERRGLMESRKKGEKKIPLLSSSFSHGPPCPEEFHPGFLDGRRPFRISQKTTRDELTPWGRSVAWRCVRDCSDAGLVWGQNPNCSG